VGASRRRFLVGLAATVAAVCGGAAPASATEIPHGFFGLGNWSYPDDAQAATLGAAGLGVFRAALVWDSVEPQRGNRNWSGADGLAARAQRNGFDILFVLSGCARWACGSDTAPPKDEPALSQYRQFVTAAVQRYGANGTAWHGAAHPRVMWQIGNEVNGGHYFGKNPSPADYAAFLSTVGSTVKNVDASATIVASGLVDKPADADGVALEPFLRGLYAVPGFTSSFDAVAVHGYADSPEGTMRVLDTTRAVMLEAGDAARPVWVTEMGWASDGPLHPFRVDEATQAAYLRSAWDTMLACRSRWNLQRVMWFAYSDIDPGLVGEQDYWGVHNGLLRADLTPKPAYAAFLEHLAPTLPEGRADSCGLAGGAELDVADPDTTIVASPDVTSDTAGPTVSFRSGESSAHFECSMDGVEAWHACTSPWAVPSSREGLHWLSVRAIDDQGNVDPSPARADWMLDLTAPDTTLVSRIPRASSRSTLSVSFTGRDAVGVAGFQCRIDKRGWTPCRSPFSTPKLKPGRHSIAIRSVDKAGHVDPTPLKPSFTIARSTCAQGTATARTAAKHQPKKKSAVKKPVSCGKGHATKKAKKAKKQRRTVK
jgi:hypothetical protein